MPHGFNEGSRPFGFTSTTQPIPSSGYTWGMPHGFNEGFHNAVSDIPTPVIQQSTSVPQPGAIIPEFIVTYSAPLVHTNRQDWKPVFPTESVEAFDGVESLHDTIDEMKREMKALRGKDVFRQNVQELCLVPIVVVPPKFKVPDFDKYIGNTCPRVHLTIYVRKMSTQAYNDQMLVHFF